jgi:nitrate reductase molybdenum cofactor assembly chaperone NarJ/NarW
MEALMAMGGRETCRSICQLFAELLDYPTGDPAETARQCADLLKGSQAGAVLYLDRFRATALDCGISRLEEAYASMFDLQPSCCPYLGHQLCGESHRRSLLMVKLRELYREYGYTPGEELPDHLGEVLRFLAVLEDERLRLELTTDGLLPALEKMVQSLADSANPYGEIIKGLRVFLIGETAAGFPDVQPEEVVP